MPSGVLWGLRHQLGSFDGCMSAGASSPVGARYCLVSVRHQPPLATPGAAPPSPPRTRNSMQLPGRPAEHRPWETVSELMPDQDVSEILSVSI